VRLLAPGVLLLIFVVALVALGVYLAAARRRRLAGARWAPASRALRGGGHVIELRCPGQPPQLVERIEAGVGWEELGDRMAEGMAEAELRAATLNGALGPPRR